MSAAAILDGLHRRGVKLRAADDRLRWRAPEPAPDRGVGMFDTHMYNSEAQVS